MNSKLKFLVSLFIFIFILSLTILFILFIFKTNHEEDTEVSEIPNNEIEYITDLYYILEKNDPFTTGYYLNQLILFSLVEFKNINLKDFDLYTINETSTIDDIAYSPYYLDDNVYIINNYFLFIDGKDDNSDLAETYTRYFSGDITIIFNNVIVIPNYDVSINDNIQFESLIEIKSTNGTVDIYINNSLFSTPINIRNNINLNVNNSSIIINDYNSDNMNIYNS